MDCLFCKIIAGEIPALRVYEDEHVVAFLDIGPINVGHTLVVPRAHRENLMETSDDDVAATFRAAKKIGKAAVAATGADGFNVGVNTGAAAGQVIMHTHVHVIPRFAHDGLKHWPKVEVPDEKSASVAAAMRELLSAA